MTFTVEWKDSPLHREVLDSLYLLFSIFFDLLEDVATTRRVSRADNRDNDLESKLIDRRVILRTVFLPLSSSPLSSFSRCIFSHNRTMCRRIKVRRVKESCRRHTVHLYFSKIKKIS